MTKNKTKVFEKEAGWLQEILLFVKLGPYTAALSVWQELIKHCGPNYQVLNK